MTLAIGLFGLGLLLVFFEVLVPSMGLLTVGAIAAVLGSLWAAFNESTQTGLTFLVLVAVAFPVTVLFAFRVFPRSPLGRRMVQGGLSFDSTAATDARDLDLVGQDGLTTSDLRPAGYARIGERRVDVVSRGESIPAGTPVRVLEVSGNRVVVVRVPTDAPAPTDTTPSND
ncbi:MAG: NfeD family protein [Planctomycetota bacterium]